MNRINKINLLSDKFISECRIGNISKAISILDKLQKKIDKEENVYKNIDKNNDKNNDKNKSNNKDSFSSMYLCTCKARINIHSYKIEYAINNIDDLMSELKNIIY